MRYNLEKAAQTLVKVYFTAPEGAACLPALRKLIEQDLVKENECVVIFNTGAGVKYLECFQ